jgi:hypothetical protein
LVAAPAIPEEASEQSSLSIGALLQLEVQKILDEEDSADDLGSRANSAPLDLEGGREGSREAAPW